MSNTEMQFHFKVVESEELKQEIYRLRYHVYVEECGFENPEDHPRGLETDPYDAAAIHLGAFNDAEELVGGCRLVMPSEQGLPIEHAVSLHGLAERPPQETTAEISRLVIFRTYRRRIEDGLYGFESYDSPSSKPLSPQQAANQEKRRRPVILLGLFRLIYLVSKEAGLTHLYLIAEKKLGSMLKRYNLLFPQIADPVEYHGIRIPYLGSLAAIEEHLQKANRPSYRIFITGEDAVEHAVHPSHSSLAKVL